MPFISSRVSHQECVAQGSSGTSFNASRSRLLKKRRRDTLVFLLTPLLGHSFSPSVLFFLTFFLRLLSLFPFLAFSYSFIFFLSLTSSHPILYSLTLFSVLPFSLSITFLFLFLYSPSLFLVPFTHLSVLSPSFVPYLLTLLFPPSWSPSFSLLPFL